MSAAYLNAALTDDQRRKLVATWRAKLALVGYAVEEMADQSFVVAKFGLSSKPLRDVDALIEFATKRLGIQ